MLSRRFMPVYLLAVVLFFTTFCSTGFSAQGDPSWAPTRENLELEYNSVWVTIRNLYQNPAKLSDWDKWKGKYDGRLHTEEDLNRALKEMVDSLDDRYTNYTSPDDVYDATKAQFGSTVDSGLTLKERDDGMYLVSYLTYDSPAHKADIRKGDVIESINGLMLKDKCGKDIQPLLEGKLGSRFEVVLVEGTIRRVVGFTLTVTPGLTWTGRWRGGGIYSLRIPRFSKGQAQQTFVDMVMEFVQENDAGLKGLIIDLRGNAGGSLEEVIAITGMLLEEGKIVTVRERRKDVVESREYRVVPGIHHIHAGKCEVEKQVLATLKTVPLVVIVDELSASASELMAGALKDHKRALVVGTTTFGKGIGSALYAMPNGGELLVRTLIYETPSGFCPNGVGITPDQIVARPRGSTGDVQFDAAMQELKKKMSIIVP